MELFSYTIKLIDPLFYSQEALAGAYTPAFLHATAINHAVVWAMGRPREDQKYIISEKDGGRNIPRYQNSWIEPDFYFTPARISGDLEYLVETVKGDQDYYIQAGYGQAKIMGVSVGRNEVLKAYRIFSFPPEKIFYGYLHAESESISQIPALIRLGSFRGKAELTVGKVEKTFGIVQNQYVNHPVDPLVSRVRRGIMINMFPYPLVENALVESVIEIRKNGRKEYVALPVNEKVFDVNEISGRLNEIKNAFPKIENPSVPYHEKAQAILHIIRKALSIKLFLLGISSEERLNRVLEEMEGYEQLRLATKNTFEANEELLFARFIEKGKDIIHECEKKIGRAEKGSEPKNSGDRPSSLIL